MIQTTSDSATAKPWMTIDLTGQVPTAIDTEFKPKPATDVFDAVGLARGRRFGSKSGYRKMNQRHFFVPNANVFCRSHGKVWWGDLDLWRDARRLEQAAQQLRCRLFVLQEHDGRFDKAELPLSEVREQAVWHTGGPIMADRELIRRSGLTAGQLSILVGVSAHRLAHRQIPYVALQINRKLTILERIFQPIAKHQALKKWGTWCLVPHPALNGRSPLDALRAGESIDPVTLAAKALTDEESYKTMMGCIALSGCGRISLQWPIIQRI